MNKKFDELTRSLAQSGTRRAALKKFGVGIAGMALACFGLANKAVARPGWCHPDTDPCCCRKCKTYLDVTDPNYFYCTDLCKANTLCWGL
jgi:hypothetical protein